MSPPSLRSSHCCCTRSRTPSCRSTPTRPCRRAPIAYPLAVLAIPAAWLLFWRRQPFPVVSDLLFTAAFLVDTAGNALDLYDSIEWWDDLNHLGNWVLLSAAFVALGWPHGATRLTRIALGVGLRSRRGHHLGAARVRDLHPRLSGGGDRLSGHAWGCGPGLAGEPRRCLDRGLVPGPAASRCRAARARRRERSSVVTVAQPSGIPQRARSLNEGLVSSASRHGRR